MSVLCLTLCWALGKQPWAGRCCPWNTACMLVKVKVKLLSRVRLFATPWTVACQALRSLSVQGIFQARVLEWIAISFSRGSSQPRDWTRVSHVVGRRFTVWATREVKQESWDWGQFLGMVRTDSMLERCLKLTAQRGARTHDPGIKSPMLYRLS